MKFDFKNQIYSRAFTLIELLVVISIIGILAGIITVSFTSSQKQARDTQRMSDLRAYHSSLEVFADKNNGMYPMWASASTPNFISQLCPRLGFVGSCPIDPKYKADNPDPLFPQYGYQTDGTLNDLTATATQFILWAKLENTTVYSIICSSGSTFTSGTQPNITNCQ